MRSNNARPASAQDRPNQDRGVLFINADKADDRAPDYRGNINVGGQEFWLSGWVNESKTGVKYISLSIRPKIDPPKAEPTGGSAPRFGDSF
jgi:hypothetical protein